MMKIDKLFDINILKDNQYKFIKLFMRTGMSISLIPRNVILVEKLNDDIGLVRLVTKNKNIYFNMEDITLADLTLDKDLNPETDNVLTYSQKFFINELNSKKNEVITLFFCTSPVTSITINPSEITKATVIENGDDLAFILEIGNEKNFFALDSILRMEVK